MTDRYGPRGVVALHIPLQNANMQPEYEMLRPDGVNNQIYRIDLGNPDEVSEATVAVIAGSLGCHPDIVVVGNSIEMRNWSVERQDRHRALLQSAIGEIPLVLGGDATVAALRAVGARRIAMLSPMQAHHANSAASYYEAMGFEVASSDCLGVGLPQDIINVSDQTIIDGFASMDRSDVDTLLHVGGALSTVPLVAQLEDKHKKPVITVNAATYWMALRRLGINDKIKGFGQLLGLPMPDEEA
ncbi:MAG: maleate cis-trans isomerase family protein [Hyphomicrobiaceae bacterium]